MNTRIEFYLDINTAFHNTICAQGPVGFEESVPRLVVHGGLFLALGRRSDRVECTVWIFLERVDLFLGDDHTAVASVDGGLGVSCYGDLEE